MKILVTGCLGFIGFNFIKSTSNKYEITGIDFFKKSDKHKTNRLKNLKLEKKKFKLYNLNLENKDNLKKIKNRNFDLILHLAAKPGVFESEANPQIYVKKNILMLTNILQFTKENNIKYFYFGSSSSVYGGEDFFENTKKLKPKSIYGLTKKMGEELVSYYSNTYKINSICLRFFTVYGPFGRPDMSYYKFLLLNKMGKTIEVYNKGNNRRPFTFIDDLILMIDKLIQKKIRNRIFEKKNYDIFNIGANTYYSVNDMLSVLKKIDKNLNFKIKYLKLLTVDPIITRAQCKKLSNYIGHHEYVKLEEGLRKFYTWFKNIKN
jgi:UDP-glucuronate 4-epimerase